MNGVNPTGRSPLFGSIFPSPFVAMRYSEEAVADSLVAREALSPKKDATYPSGRLAGAGKRRIFVITNYGALRPVHDWLMSILRCLKMDGTFNQEAL